MYYYSAKNNAFYPADLRKVYEGENAFPSDAISVSESVWMEYAGREPPSGMVRTGGSNGMPVWSLIPGKTNEELISEAETRKATALSEINSVTQIWQSQLLLGIIGDADKDKLVEWMIYAKKIQAIDTNKAVDIHWPAPPKK